MSTKAGAIQVRHNPFRKLSQVTRSIEAHLPVCLATAAVGSLENIVIGPWRYFLLRMNATEPVSNAGLRAFPLGVQQRQAQSHGLLP